MRKLAAILLLAILLFNWLGYQLLADYWQSRVSQQLEVRLDEKNFDASQLIEVKVPMRLPYQYSRTDFERYDGEIEIDGTYYKYVMRRIYNDSLILLCLPNEKKTAISQATNHYYKLVNDLDPASKTGDTHKNLSKIAKNMLTDVLPCHPAWGIAALAPAFITYSSNSFIQYTAPCLDVPHQPPGQGSSSLS